MSTSTGTSNTNYGSNTNQSSTYTPAQQQAILSALSTAQGAATTSTGTIPYLTNEFTGITNTGNTQANTGQGALTSGVNTLTNFAPTVESTAEGYMSGFNPTAVTNAQTQGALDEANKVAMPAIASNAAATGNVNSSGTGVAQGIVQNSLADQWAQLYGQNANNAWSTSLGNATTGVLGSAADLASTGNTAVNSGTSTGGVGATGVNAAPFSSVDQLLAALGINAGGTTTGTGSTSGYQDTTTTSTPSALSTIGSLIGAGGSLLGSSGGLLGGGSGILGIASALKSDVRTKDHIRLVGHMLDGTPIYTFRYKGDHETQMGVMAQEIEHTHPEAVREFAGFKYVDYSKL